MSEVGRPKVNRELLYQLIKAGKSTRYITRVLKCSSRLVRLAKKELKNMGEVVPQITDEQLDKLERDFDEELETATGLSFKDWLKERRVDYIVIYNFCKRVWDEVWERPRLLLVKDVNNPLADQLAQKFLSFYGDDKQRIRVRKEHIRKLFIFLGRHDVCDRHLTIREARDPRSLRELPVLTSLAFPQRLERAKARVKEICGEEVETLLRFKIVTMMRTGRKDKELMGLVKEGNNGNWIVMDSEDSYRIKISAKGREVWYISWIPKQVREGLYRLYNQTPSGSNLFNIDVNLLRREWKIATKLEVGTELRLHDLRKVGLTWMYAMGVPLEIATEINVGWRDLNTAKRHYLGLRGLLGKQDRGAYVDLIPSWFKEGLEDYVA